jgi:DNA-binding protein VF530
MGQGFGLWSVARLTSRQVAAADANRLFCFRVSFETGRAGARHARATDRFRMSGQPDDMGPGAKDPLHGFTLEMIVTALVGRYGWEELGQLIDIRCFQLDPSVSSSLKFLRRTPWARKKVEDLYVYGPSTR